MKKLEKKQEMKEEPQIVIPEDFKLSVRSFCCPKCQSAAVALDFNFSKNNIVTSLEDKSNEKLTEEQRHFKYKKLVLICTNCDHRDLLDSFISNNSPQRIFDESGDTRKYPWVIDPSHLKPKRKPFYQPYHTPKFYRTIMKNEFKTKMKGGQIR